MQFFTVRPVGSASDDLLKGAAMIAAFLYGSGGRARQVYYLVERSKLPVFRLGKLICARQSTLLRWIAEQEDASYAERGRSAPSEFVSWVGAATSESLLMIRGAGS